MEMSGRIILMVSRRGDMISECLGRSILCKTEEVTNEINENYIVNYMLFGYSSICTIRIECIIYYCIIEC